MKSRLLSALGVATAWTVLVGCATVNPRADYENVGGHITDAVGPYRTYHPDNRDDVPGIVSDLLQDGVTATEAVQISLLNSPSLHAAFMDVGMARADVVQAGLLSNPFIGISLRMPDGGGLANLEASIAQQLAELWQIPNRQRSAQRLLHRTILNVAYLAAQRASQTKTAYYLGVATSERHRIAQENLVITRDLLELALVRQDAGATSELDVNLSRSLAIGAEIEVEQARLAASEALHELSELLGLAGDAKNLVLSDELPEAYPTIADPSTLVELAQESRLDLRAARDAHAVAQTKLEEERLMVFPSLELGVELEREGRRAQGGRDLLADTARASIANSGLTAPGIQPRSERQGKGGRDTIVGPSLGFELPIFDQNQAQIAKATYAVQQARKTLEAAEQGVTWQVRRAADRAISVWRLMRTYREDSIPLAQRNLELSRESFRVGRASFLTILEAERVFLNTRSAYIDAARKAATAVCELERAVGLPFEKLVEAESTDSAAAPESMEIAAP